MKQFLALSTILIAGLTMPILDQFGRPFETGRASAQSKIAARYDNAMPTRENERAWWMSDYMSAKSANNFQVRRLLRMRSRYEVSNNPYLFGVVNNNADDLINKGPRLQCNRSGAEKIEKAWHDWAQEIDLVEKLRTCKIASTIDGEGFLVLKTCLDLENPVKIYPCDLEADQVTTPAPSNLEELWVDGLTLHPVTGRPTSYHVLKSHPGDYYFPDFNPLAVDRIPAAHVVQFFKKWRPGQVRGVPTFTPSLDLFADQRAYRKAVLGAANLAADFAAVLESDYPAYLNPGGNEYHPFQRVAINREMMVTLPYGMRMNQFRPEQPATSYEMFQEKVLAEAIRPLAYPLNLALGTSQKFNFSSAKMDFVNYFDKLDIERDEVNRIILEHLFRVFIYEASRIPGLLPDGIRSAADVPHEWHWPPHASIDPQEEAQTDHLRLAAGTLTWRKFWARRGEDWRKVFGEQAEERQALEALNLEFGDPVKRTVTESTDDPKEARAEIVRQVQALARQWRDEMGSRLSEHERHIEDLLAA